jgi:hypothetical protein
MEKFLSIAPVVKLGQFFGRFSRFVAGKPPKSAARRTVIDANGGLIASRCHIRLTAACS